MLQTRARSASSDARVRGCETRQQHDSDFVPLAGNVPINNTDLFSSFNTRNLFKTFAAPGEKRLERLRAVRLSRTAPGDAALEKVNFSSPELERVAGASHARAAAVAQICGRKRDEKGGKATLTWSKEQRE